MNRLKQFLQTIVLWSNIIAAALFILSAYSDRFSPEKHMLITYMGLAFPLFLLAVLCFLTYNMLTNNWKFAPVSILALALCWTPIQNYCPFNASQTVPKEDVIKLLTYNVMNFNFQDHTPQAPNPILKYIAESDADIVCLQEYWAHKQSKFLNTPKIHKALSMYPYRSIIDLHKTPNIYKGIAIFSKFPLSNAKRIKYESKYNGSMSCIITVKDKKILLINNHLESFKLTRTDKSTYSTLMKGEEMDKKVLGGIYGTFVKKLAPAYRLRAKQAEEVRRIVQEAKSNYVVVCGDFNDTPISYTHKTMQGTLRDAFVESGKGFGISFNENFFWFRLDNILHSESIESFNCTVERFAGSDHYPMWSHLRLKDLNKE